jgi:hypothetical protein
MLASNTKVLIVSVFIAAVARGQVQVATVSSPSAFTLRGAIVNPEQGVPDWPVLAGNTIKAGSAPATLIFPESSTIVLNPGAEATVGLSGQTPVFQLLKGSAQYSLKTLTSVQLKEASQSVSVTKLAGVLGEAGRKSGAGPWTWAAAHPFWGIAGTAAAAGLGVGVAEATSGGKSVSPSH